jgi:hypothetical protein
MRSRELSSSGAQKPRSTRTADKSRKALTEALILRGPPDGYGSFISWISFCSAMLPLCSAHPALRIRSGLRVSLYCSGAPFSQLKSINLRTLLLARPLPPTRTAILRSSRSSPLRTTSSSSSSYHHHHHQVTNRSSLLRPDTTLPTPSLRLPSNSSPLGSATTGAGARTTTVAPPVSLPASLLSFAAAASANLSNEGQHLHAVPKGFPLAFLPAILA